MSRQLRVMGGGVDDAHCCVTHKPGNSWSQQSVHHFIRGRQDEQLDNVHDLFVLHIMSHVYAFPSGGFFEMK